MPKFNSSSFLDELIKREHSDNSLRLPKNLVNNRLLTAQNLYNKNLVAHFGCVNAIEFLNGGQLLASGGDDRRVLLWNVQETLQGIGSPHAMRAQHVSNIFCLGFDSKNKKLFSAGNDDQVIVHDIQTGVPIDYFLYEQPIYGLSVDPSNDDVFACACDEGRVLMYDVRAPAGSEPSLLAKSTSAYHGVMYNPIESRLIATANAKDGACIWDTRQPRIPLVKCGNPDSCMSVRWNNNGTQILALRRRMPPVLYSVESSEVIAQFDHPGYFNSCTMKSCCFAGYDDEYVLSGSDNFNLYMWKVPSSETKGQWISPAHLVLSGHRSIVNQVRFNPDNCLIASSGVEKLIKVWSPFPLPWSSGGLEKDSLSNKRRKVFSHEEYISLVMRSGQIISHDYSQESTKEDPRMMAFFDSLVQREIEGWSSDESLNDASHSPSYTDRSLPGSEENDDNVGNGIDAHDSSDSSDDDDDDNNDGDDDDDDDNRNDLNVTGDESGCNNGRLRKIKNRNNQSNPIVKLIAKKRAQLMRLGKYRSKKKTSCLQKMLNSLNTINNYDNSNNDSSPSSGSTSSSSNSSSSSSLSNSSKRNRHNDSDSNNDNNNHLSSSNNSDTESLSDTSDDSKSSSDIGASNRRKKIKNKLRSKRKLLKIDNHDEHTSLDSEDDNGDNRYEEENNNKKCDNNKNKGIKRRNTNEEDLNSFKIKKLAIRIGKNVNNNNVYKSDCDKLDRIYKADNNLVTDLTNMPTTSVSRLCDDSITSNSTTPDSNRTREGETQDSGIFMSDFNISNVIPLKKSSKHIHRNYRKKVVNKSDDSDN